LAETFAGGALLFGFNELAGSLPGEYSDEFPKTRIGLRRIVGRHGVGRHEDHPDALSQSPFPLRHNAILSVERTIPLEAKTGPGTGCCECEIAGIAATSVIERRSSSYRLAVDR
jgi:hypothetical protein